MRLVIEGRRKPYAWEGFWQCPGCDSVYEFTYQDMSDVCTNISVPNRCVHNYSEVGNDMISECRVCKRRTTMHRYEGEVPDGIPKEGL